MFSLTFVADHLASAIQSLASEHSNHSNLTSSLLGLPFQELIVLLVPYIVLELLGVKVQSVTRP